MGEDNKLEFSNLTFQLKLINNNRTIFFFASNFEAKSLSIKSYILFLVYWCYKC